LAFAATRPGAFRVQRAASIKAPAEQIFPLIDDFHRWGSWSPWEKRDPAMKRAFGGASSGRGAIYEWDGNAKVGKGRMEITDRSPPSRVTVKLDFLRPLEGHNICEFTLEPTGDATSVTWAMRGAVPFIGKVIHVFFNMDRMVGRDFEAGLSNLKAVVEK